jgi:hypothetical protein
MSQAPSKVLAVLIAAALLACGKSAAPTVDQVVAGNDTLVTTRGAPVQTSNVLANDSDPMGKPIFVTAWTQGTLGDVTYDGNGIFTYTPHASAASGADSFTYTIVNSLGTSATATVNVTLTASWGTPEILAPSVANVFKAKGVDAAGHDALGNATYFWTATDGTRTKLWANRVSGSGAWGTTVRVDIEDLGTGNTIGSLQAVADGSGNVTAVWSQDDGTRTNMWSNRMTASGTWGTAVKIEADDAGSVSAPALVVDGSGNVTAVWPQSDGTVNNIWSNRMTAAGAWGTAAKIETEVAGNASTPQLFVDAAGNVTAIWQKYDGTRLNLRANRMTAAGAWNAAPSVLSNGTSYVYSFSVQQQVSGASAGALTAVWYQADPGITSAYASHLVPSTGVWTTVGPLNSDVVAGHSVGTPQATICPAGTNAGSVVAIWYQYDGVTYNASAARMSAAGAWGTSTQFTPSPTPGSIYGTFLTALDGACNLTVVWPQYDGTRYNQWANRMTAAGTWLTAQLIETENLGSVQPAQPLLVDTSSGTTAGNVTAVWRQYDGTNYNLWSNRFNNGTSSWGTAVKIENEDLGSPDVPQTVIDASGNVTAVWSQFDAVRRNEWSNRMTAAGAWGTPQKIETQDLGSTSSPRIVVDSAGAVTAVWPQTDGVRQDVWGNRMDASGTWAGAQNLTSGLEGASGSVFDLLLEGTGTAPLVVGQEYNGVSSSLWATDLR